MERIDVDKLIDALNKWTHVYATKLAPHTISVNNISIMLKKRRAIINGHQLRHNNTPESIIDVLRRAGLLNVSVWYKNLVCYHYYKSFEEVEAVQVSVSQEGEGG